MGQGAAGSIGEPGLIIDRRYRLERLLGSGGFGEVWRAEQEVEGQTVRHVALKLLTAPGTGSSRPDNDEWLNEVKVVQGIDCPAIAPIYDVGIAREREVAFISMVLLEGETVDARLERGPIHWRRALRIAREVGSALAACHREQVHHCDLKPQNIFLHRDGRVFVLDFGIARLGQSESAPVRPSMRSAVAPSADMATGTVEVDPRDLPSEMPPVAAEKLYGTVGYIAPERFSGEPPSPESDAYALGVTLYVMLAGRLPYAVGDVPATASSSSGSDEDRRRLYARVHTATIQGQVVPLGDVAPDVPVGVAQLVERLLSADPGARLGDGFERELDRVWRSPHGVPDPPYIGLESFGSERAGHIAGRDADIEQIASRLERERMVVLVGPSGCGKSSLAVAGVAPRLDELMLDDADGWRVDVVRPPELAGLELGAHEQLGTVVVIDQLEEVVSLSDADRDAFAARLRQLVEGEPSRVRVVATMRDDLFGRVAALPELARLPERNVYTVRGVEPNAMDDIVRRPAREAGYEIEGGEEVVGEAQRVIARDSSALPLLQFALTQWWAARDRDARVLRRDAWLRVGGIEGALGATAQALYEQMPSHERHIARELFVPMFRSDGTRRRVRAGAVASSESHRTVLATLVEHRLLLRHGAGEKAVVEVVHESLAHRWPALRGWLAESRAERELLDDAHKDAQRWTDAGKPDELLWRGRRLASLVDLAVADEPIAGFTRAAAHLARKSKRSRRLIAGAVAAAIGVALVAALSYVASDRERKKAESARLEALEQASIAQQERDKNEALRLAAEHEKTRALDEKRDADRAREAERKLRGEADELRARAEAASKVALEKEQEARDARDQVIAARNVLADLERQQTGAARKDLQQCKKDLESQNTRALAAEARRGQLEKDLRGAATRFERAERELDECEKKLH